MGGEIANFPSINYGLFRSPIKKWLIRFVAKHLDAVVVLSNHYAQKFFDQVTSKRVEIIPFGINLDDFPVTNKLLLPPYHFLYLGNLNRIKDLQTLLKTFKRIKQQVDAKLTLVGVDTLSGEVQQLAIQLGIHTDVQFHRYQSNNHLHLFLEKTHILLHTSRWESQAVVVNEAIAAGVVVCGTMVGLIDDLSDQITIAVGIGDDELLSEKVLSLLNNPAAYEQRRRNGIIWSQNHDLNKQYQQYACLYKSLLAK